LTPEIVEMLKAGASGIKSNGPKGIYEVQGKYCLLGHYEDTSLISHVMLDLLRVKDSFGEVADIEDAGQAKIMASFLGVNQEYDSASRYRFVINSRTGRYIDPVYPNQPHAEVDFVQGWSQFKLLGWEEINGGEGAVFQ
jgi:hypothetical protein